MTAPLVVAAAAAAVALVAWWGMRRLVVGHRRATAYLCLLATLMVAGASLGRSLEPTHALLSDIETTSPQSIAPGP
jgi:hypothetical protein